MIDLPSKGRMTSIIEDQICMFSQKEANFFESIKVPLLHKRLKWEYGENESYNAWIFADFKERNVGAVYCQGGFGKMGAPWGLTFFNDDNFGMDFGWYSSIKDMINDGWLDDDT